MSASQNKSQFVAVASIAAELSAVMEVAKEISLAAANAKAIAFRAGEKAKGFQPITDFINELAKDTIQLVNNINEHALKLYRLTVKQHRMTEACRRFEMVAAAAESAAYAASLTQSLALIRQHIPLHNTFCCVMVSPVKVEELLIITFELVTHALASVICIP